MSTTAASWLRLEVVRESGATGQIGGFGAFSRGPETAVSASCQEQQLGPTALRALLPPTSTFSAQVEPA
jgi:hypothetical protein